MQFRSQDSSQDIDVNLTPLVDVIFLLLIFFMVSTTFDTTSQLKINLPQADAPEVKKQQNKLELTINAKGDFYLNGGAVVNQSARALTESIRRLVGNDNQDINVIIQSDAATPVQSLVTAMDVVSRLGLANLSIATVKGSSK